MFLRATSAAGLLDLPISTFYQLVREGRLPPAASKVGKHQLWRKDSLVAAVDPRGYKAAHEAETPAGHSHATKAQWTGPLLPAAGPRNGLPGATYKASRRSPYAGILGGTSVCPALDFEPLDLRSSDHRHG